MPLKSVIRTLYSIQYSTRSFPPLHRSSAPICTFAPASPPSSVLRNPLRLTPSQPYSSQPAPSRPSAALTFPPLHRISAPICTFALSHCLLPPLAPLPRLQQRPLRIFLLGWHTGEVITGEVLGGGQITSRHADSERLGARQLILHLLEVIGL